MQPENVQHVTGKRAEQYRLNPATADEHRWFYFPQMRKDEVLFFKQYDSDPKARSRFCFHTAFDDPTVPRDAPLRQSIEVRALALFNNAMVAPPPIAKNLSEKVFQARTAGPEEEPGNGRQARQQASGTSQAVLRAAWIFSARAAFSSSVALGRP